MFEDTSAQETNADSTRNMLQVVPRPTIRSRSLFLAAYPWSTDAVVCGAQWPNPCPPGHFLHNFLSHLIHYEAKLATSAEKQITAVRSLMRIRPKTIGLNEQLTSEADAQQLCSLLCSYKLIDVVSELENWPSRMEVPLHRKRDGITTSFRAYTPMNNFQTLLVNFKDAVAGLDSLGDPVVTTGHPRLRLIGSLCRTRRASAAMGYIMNVEFAALHAHHILTETFAKGSLPDIPTKLSDFFTNDISELAPQLSLTEEENKDLQLQLASLRAACIRNPLLAALMISPSVWFVSNQLWKASWGIVDIVTLNWARGNMKPPYIRKFEKTCWLEFFKVVRGEQSAFACLRNIANSIDLAELEAAGPQVHSWFHADFKSSRRKLPQVSMDLEDNLAHGWPLREQLLDEFGHSVTVQGRHINSAIQESTATSETIPQETATALSIDENLTPVSAAGDSVPPIPNGETANEDKTPKPKSSDQPSKSKRRSTRLSKMKEAAEDDDGEGNSASTSDSDSAVGELPVPRRSSNVILKAQPETDNESDESDESAESEESEEGTALPKPPKKQERVDIVANSNQHGRRAVSRKEMRSIIIKDGGSAWNPIDIDELMALPKKVILNPILNVPKLENYEGANRFSALCGFERAHDIKLVGHSPASLSRVCFVVQKAESHFINNAPYHFTDPPRSVFSCFMEGAFARVHIQHLLHDFRQEHFVIRKEIPESFTFDPAGLSSIEKLAPVITIHDHSLDFKSTMNEIAKDGNLQQLLDSMRYATGKILSALSVPMYSVAMPRGPLFSENAAWRATVGDPYCRDDGDKEDFMPVGDMRRGMAGNQGSMQWWHLDPDGLGTLIEVKTGMLYLAVARPFGMDDENIRGMRPDFDDMMEPWEFHVPFNPLIDNHEKGCEALCILKGDRIYLRPNTPYFVYFADHSVCHISHFYASSTMHDSLVAMIHSFVLGDVISEPARPRTRKFIQRMIHFYHRGFVRGESNPAQDEDWFHLPVLEDMQGIQNFLSLCIMAILINVLDPRTYVYPGRKVNDALTPAEDAAVDEYDVNSLDYVRRLKHTITRDLAYQLVVWLFNQHEFRGDTGVVDGYTAVFVPMITHVCRSLLLYKMDAVAAGVPGAPHCTVESLRRQIEMCFSYEKEISEQMKLDMEYAHYNFYWKDLMHFTVKRLPATTQDVPSERGYSEGDRKFFGYKHPNEREAPTTTSRGESGSSSRNRAATKRRAANQPAVEDTSVNLRPHKKRRGV